MSPPAHITNTESHSGPDNATYRAGLAMALMGVWIGLSRWRA